jgi:hypothetical protein
MELAVLFFSLLCIVLIVLGKVKTESDQERLLKRLSKDAPYLFDPFLAITRSRPS